MTSAHVRSHRRGAIASLILSVMLLTACATGGEDAGDPSSGPGTAAPDAQSVAPAAPTPERGPGMDPEAPGLPAAGTTLPSVTLTEVVVLAAPVATEVTDDGLVLVAERAGRIRVLDGPDPGPVLLDLSGRTTTDGERGLLDIALAPWGDELVVSRTDLQGDTLVEAYPFADGRITDAPRTLYTLEQPYANHNGGALLFLPDGTLLLGLGDGGGAGDPLGAGQDITTPLGGLVRLDVRDGTRIPSDNPFVEVEGAAPELAATGLRNPWRMSLDAARGELWIADVGQSSREEIDRVHVDELLGANFGWALREGSTRFLGDDPAGHLPPVHEYPHGPGCSVTGGVVYRGTDLPALIGGYVFADLCDGTLRVLVQDGEQDTGIAARSLGVAAEQPIGFGLDADGELLVLEFGGRVLRLAPS